MTDINQLGKLRYPEIALANARIVELDEHIDSLLATVEREHAGMINWKKTAEQKDADLITMTKKSHSEYCRGYVDGEEKLHASNNKCEQLEAQIALPRVLEKRFTIDEILKIYQDCTWADDEDTGVDIIKFARAVISATKN